MNAPPSISSLDQTEATIRRVYVIDDDVDVRASLHFLLSAKGRVTTSFGSGSEFLAHIDSLAPALLLIDLQMPRMSGFDLLTELAKRKIGWPAVVLTGCGDVALAVSAMKLGAIDFLEKPIDGDRIEEALTYGFTLLDESEQEQSKRASARYRVASLTARQAKVIEGLIRGLSNKQVALSLELSPRTVEMHRAAALRKLKIRTVSEALSLIISSGYMTTNFEMIQ